MKTVLVTGCSSGFGKLAVSLLLQRGHTVIAALRGGQQRLESVFPAELKAHSGRLHALDLHMEKPASFEEARKLVATRFGGHLDALVNNAGYGLMGSIEDVSEEQLRHQMEVNFFGPALLTRALLPALRLARGRVINVTSVCGRHGFPQYAAYNASKFALEGLTEAMHYDLRSHGVAFCLVEPGGFRTDFSSRSLMFGQGSFEAGSVYRARNESFRHYMATSTSRLGNPARVARLLARLVDEARPRLRYPIGPDSRLMNFVAWLVPERLRMWLLDRAFRFAIFKD